MTFRDLKLENLDFAQKLKSAGLLKLSNQIASCSTIIDTKFFANTNRISHNINRCKNRFCPICSRQRQLDHTHKVAALLEEMKNRNIPIHAAFLTFTIKNCTPDDLSDNINILKATWSKIIHRKFFKNIIWGYIYYIDITFKADGSCHPHLHIIIFFNEHKYSFFPSQFWRNIWQDAGILNYMSQVKSIPLKSSADIIKSANYSIKPLILNHVNSNVLANIIRQLSHKCLFAVSKTVRHYITPNNKKLDIDTIDPNYLLARSIWSRNTYILIGTDIANSNNNYPLLHNSS